jgi:hypothetical protein
MWTSRWLRRALSVLLVGSAAAGAPAPWAPPVHGPRTSTVAGSAGAASDRDIAQRFEQLRVNQGELSYGQLAQRLAVAPAPDAGPSFDPTEARYWKEQREALQLTAEDQGIFRRTGLVGVDTTRRFTMAQAYWEIYRRDLPVLITTDSILNALHRSFDVLVDELESNLAPMLIDVLAGAHRALRKEAPALTAAGLRRSAQDVDLYLTVARNLLRDTDLDRPIASVFAQGADVRAVLAAIAALQPEAPPALYGRDQALVDWSQFAPRGHYAKSPASAHYFQTLMWLGRVDTGFALSAGARERTDAALLAWLLRKSQRLDKLQTVERLIAFLVGFGDDVMPPDLAEALQTAGVHGVADLASSATIDAAVTDLARRGIGVPRTRSQTAIRLPDDRDPETPLASVFQLFGQRFVIDSFVLSKVVFDSIEFKGERPRRFMPSGLDVAAALGNDEAVALLEPELAGWNYGANLLAARRVVEERPPEAWNATLYDIWLSALTKLDDIPAGEFPQVMRGRAWQRKQLETQLASWAELRHDTLLSAKQPYSVVEGCEYPAGYVEPYPELYARLAFLADETRRRLSAIKMEQPEFESFLATFATIVRHLEAVARTELAGMPFSPDDELFIKQTIHVQPQKGGGCGAPSAVYTGWYPKLLYEALPADWEPTVADVHTDPNSHTVLEEGTGSATFAVVAIDNQRDRAVYVGPVSSYYEFTSPERLTDEGWERRIRTQPRPAWTAAWRGPPTARQLSGRR